MMKPREFKEIVDTIEKKERTRLRVETGFSQKSIQLIDKLGESVLLVKESTSSDRLIISHMSFKKQREGLGSEVLEKLKTYAISKQYTSILVENAVTRPMIEFCKKQGFKTVEGEVFIKEDGELYGNYLLSL